MVGCSLATGTRPSNATLRVLFIGNSLTYVNDLPGMVQALADSAQRGPIEVASVVAADFALVDNWNAGNAHSSIRRGGWNLVVLQQGPSSLQINRDSLRLLTGFFNQEIAGIGARAALYSVWPMNSRRQDFARAIESYRLASEDVAGLYLPVASAWLNAWEIDANLRLYSLDGLHASVEGTYLAALVLYARMFDATPVGLPARFRLRSGALVEVDPANAGKLQQAAATAAAGAG
jgi:hypothetical protein